MISRINPYSIFIDCKNYLYDKKYFHQIQTNVKIISIGNLNTGGSGKTPLIQYIAELLIDKKILIVCKSYKAKLRSAQAVNLNDPNCVAVFGDEACLLKQYLPQCDVWSGPSKSQTVIAALKSGQTYDFILIDDGFSHRQIGRHLDIVLVDASRSPSHYQIFPFGQMREDWGSLIRADIVILTKTEGLTTESKQFFIDHITKYQNKIIFANFKTVFLPQTTVHNKKLFLITGIGNPKKLTQDLLSDGFQVLRQKIYADHFSFPESEQLKLLSMIGQSPELQSVVTAKDYIKINNLQLRNILKVVTLKISMTETDRKSLYDKIFA